jgi:hypothetical protein
MFFIRYFLFPLVGFQPYYITRSVLKRGSIIMLLLYTGWQLDADCTVCWYLFDLLLIGVLIYSILEGSIAIGRRLETRSY